MEEIEITKKLVKQKILSKVRHCKTCNGDVELKFRNSHSGNKLITWRCKRCQRYHSVVDRSFFSLFKKPIMLILQLIKFWSLGINISKTCETIKQMELSKS